MAGHTTRPAACDAARLATAGNTAGAVWACRAGLVWIGLVWFGLVWFGLDWFGLMLGWVGLDWVDVGLMLG